jgi:hypothetical protein
LLVAIVPIRGDPIDKGLVVYLVLARRDRNRLAVRLGSELGGANIRHPDLEWA